MPIVPTVHATGTEVTPYIQVQQILHMVKATTPTPTLANATIVMPDNETEVSTPCLSKLMGGNKDKDGWYGRIAEFVYEGKIFSGQIMFYEKK